MGAKPRGDRIGHGQIQLRNFAPICAAFGKGPSYMKMEVPDLLIGGDTVILPDRNASRRVDVVNGPGHLVNRNRDFRDLIGTHVQDGFRVTDRYHQNVRVPSLLSRDHDRNI